MRLLGLAGSLRNDSFNRRLLDAAAAELSDGASIDVWDGIRWLPPYCEDDDGPGAPLVARALRAELEEADGLVVATPEYNHSLPGVLKNALDWASRPWPDNALVEKPTAVIGASASAFGAVWAQAETRKVLTALGAHVIDRELPVAHAHQAFGSDGRLADPTLREQLRSIVNDLVALAGERSSNDRRSA